MKIADLPVVASPTGAEQAVVLVGGVAKRAAISDLAAAAAADAIAGSVTAAGESATAAGVARDASVAAKDTSVTKAAESSASAAAAEVSRASAHADYTNTVAERAVAQTAATAAVNAQHLAEAAVSIPAVDIVDGRAELRRNISLGNSDPGALYELNAGGQAVVTPGVVQIINIDGRDGYQSSMLEGAHYSNDGKPIVLNFTKSRGNGIIGDPEMNRQGLGGDRLFILGINSGGYYDGYSHLDQPRAGACGGHAGYLTWTQEYDSKTTQGGPNSVDAMFHLMGQSANDNFLGQGGIQGNCLAQVYFSGPNKGQHNARERYRALVEIGPGTGVGDNMQVVGFNSSPLVDPIANPDRIFDGGVEYYNGNFYITHSFVAGVLDRRMVLTAPALAPGAVPTNAGWTASLRMGTDWAELTVTVGGADVATFAGRINFAANLSAIPIVVGSHTTSDLTDGTRFIYAPSVSRITCNLVAGTMKAGQTYIFSVIIRQP